MSKAEQLRQVASERDEYRVKWLELRYALAKSEANEAKLRECLQQIFDLVVGEIGRVGISPLEAKPLTIGTVILWAENAKRVLEETGK